MEARRIVLRKYGRPDVMRTEAFEPEGPGAGEVQVRVAYGGVNFADLMMRMGLYQAAPPLPFTPGYEVSGTIEALGEGVEGLKRGDAVAAVSRFGGYTTHLNVGAAQLFPVKGLTHQEAAAFPTVYLTAWEALVGMARVRHGDKVLVHGGAGGVGLAAIGLAKHFGCEVVATAGSPEKVRFLEDEVGVAAAFDYRAGAWRPALLDRVGRVDVVLESRGGKNIKESQKALAPRGRVVMYGAQEAAPGTRRNIPRALAALRQMRFPIMPMVRHSNGILAFHLLYMWDDGVDLKPAADEMLALMRKKKIPRPRVDRIFPADEAAAAHQHIHDRRNIGKVLLDWS